MIKCLDEHSFLSCDVFLMKQEVWVRHIEIHTLFYSKQSAGVPAHLFSCLGSRSIIPIGIFKKVLQVTMWFTTLQILIWSKYLKIEQKDKGISVSLKGNTYNPMKHCEWHQIKNNGEINLLKMKILYSNNIFVYFKICIYVYKYLSTLRKSASFAGLHGSGWVLKCSFSVILCCNLAANSLQNHGQCHFPSEIPLLNMTI